MSIARQLWLLALFPILLSLNAPVERTQEARVVETARQMLGQGARAYLIPSINGSIRLRKPPLAYWLSAAGFKLLGVSEFSGRLASALLSWGMIAVTYFVARRLFGDLTGLLSAGCLLSSYLFFKEARLAETDGPAAFFTTLAVLWFWMAVDNPGAKLFHAAAAATGLAFFSKQGPGAFALLFFIGYAIYRKRTGTLWQFFLCGAPLTLIVLAGWWYGVAAYTEGLAQFKREFVEVAEGVDHPAWFYVYFPMLAADVAPWTLIAAAAIYVAVKEARTAANIPGLLIWIGAVFVPLCFLGNKQEHYLLPLMPPMMILAGWLLERGLRDKKVRQLLGVTLIGSIIAPIAIPIARYTIQNHVTDFDLEVAGALAIVAAWSFRLLTQERVAQSALSLAAAWAAALSFIFGFGAVGLSRGNIRATAAEIRDQFGDGPYVFYGGDGCLPLCFAMRQKIDYIAIEHPRLLRDSAARFPSLVVLVQDTKSTMRPPTDFVRFGHDFGQGGQDFWVYQRKKLAEP